MTIYSGLLVTLLLLLLGGCSPGQIAGNKNGLGEYVWTGGCREVTANPSRDGSYAIGPLGDLWLDRRFFFKQKNLDGSVSTVNGKPCRG